MINRERLTNTFCELVSIDSPSGEEEEVSKYIESKLTELGFILLKDDYPFISPDIYINLYTEYEKKKIRFNVRRR